MHLEGRLEITAGQATDRGLRATNDDCMGLRLPDEPARTYKGIAAAIADGVSSAEAGREAAEICVQGFLADYYDTPDSWTTRHAARVLLTSLNRWLYVRSNDSRTHRGYLTTFSALVVKSRTAHLLHVGDTRIYRLRGARLEQLTRDHTTWINERDRFLARAMGMDPDLEVDYRQERVEPGDLFLLTTDGVHDWLAGDAIRDVLLAALSASEPFEKVCRTLIDRARAGGSDDNLSCQMIRIDAVAAGDRDEVVRELTRLPFPPPLEPGDSLDGYTVEREIHASSRSQIYVVCDAEGRRFAMKTPSVNFEDDPAYLERFVMESWIGGRIRHPNVVRVVPPGRTPTALYTLMEYVEGPTLAAWRREQGQVEVRQAVALAEQMAAGLRAFERLEMIHQDLKPENVLIDADGQVRIVDFGSCWVAGIHEIAAPITRDVALGTASYSAPETRWGATAGTRSELFSLGTVVYELLTGHLPYGEEIERCRSPRDLVRLRYDPSPQHNPMVPLWVDAAIRKAVALPFERRYGAFSEFIHDLKQPNARLLGDGSAPLLQRDPVRFWKVLALTLLALQALTLLWLTR